MLDPASCREWAEYIKGSVQKWTAAKCFRLSSREGGSPLNRRMSNEELDTNVKAFSNVRDAVGPYFEIAVHCHWEYDFFDALRLARGIEKIRPRWIEDPMPPNYTDTLGEAYRSLTGAYPHRREPLHPQRFPAVYRQSGGAYRRDRYFPGRRPA
jgi:L-alanine-DL-glutamate epimerase-like enolase superfamily enzyme